MAYDEKLAQRVRRIMSEYDGVQERRMFGGLCFMFRGNMCCGVERESLMLRVGKDQYDKALKRTHARPMDFTGRPLKGFVYVAPAGYKTAAQLKAWIRMALDFVETLPRK